MTHLPDTNVLVRLLNADPAVRAALRRSRAEIAVSSVVLFELSYGAFRSKRVSANLQRIADLPFPVISLDPNDARVAAEVRASLVAGGNPIGPYDTLIAGQALARDLTLVTHKIREFSRVPGLRLEDWET